MKKFILTSILVFSSPLLFASNEPFSGSARALGLGNATLTFSDAYSVLNNQAAMAFRKNISFSLFAEQRYFQNELGYYAAGLTLPTKKGAFGLSINYNGFDLYNEQKIGLGYAMLFSKNISGSLQIDYLSTSIAEYGTSSAFTFEAGLLVKINDQLKGAAHVFNPVAVKSGFAVEKVPTVFQLGLSYEPGKKVLLSAEVEKDIDNAARFKAGVEYKIVDVLHLRGGIETNPSQYGLGVGINVKQLKIDIAASYHQVLGVTPAFSLNYVFEKKKK
ncbi:MAG: hypothetical protein LH473_05920 [Chitinophagales bacterium]|nr:hypothetical protein [Chitinophagales bacterium]